VSIKCRHLHFLTGKSSFDHIKSNFFDIFVAVVAAVVAAVVIVVGLFLWDFRAGFSESHQRLGRFLSKTKGRREKKINLFLMLLPDFSSLLSSFLSVFTFDDRQDSEGFYKDGINQGVPEYLQNKFQKFWINSSYFRLLELE